MNIAVCDSDDAINACYPVMVQLRPHLVAGDFLARVRLQQREGYQLAAVRDAAGVVTAVAGSNLHISLPWRTLYVTIW